MNVVMYRSIVLATLVLLLAACSDDADQLASTGNMTADSEDCRSEVALQLSRERFDLTKPSDAEKVAFDQRYRFCMAEKGYTLASER